MEITQTLLDTVLDDDDIRERALQTLQLLEEKNLHDFLLCLAEELGNNSKEAKSRVLAAHRLRNCLSRVWLFLDQTAKTKIVEALYRAISSSQVVINTCASAVIRKVASVEHKENQWPSVLQYIMFDLGNSSPQTKVAVFNKLGDLCSEVNEEDIGKVLTAIVQSMSKEGMQVKSAAFGCLSLFVAPYYAKFKGHMTEIVNQTPHTAVRYGDDSLVLKALQFWISICKKESEIIHHNQSRKCFRFSQKALNRLLPIVLEKQSKFPGIDAIETNHQENAEVTSSRETCFRYLAIVVGERIVSALRLYLAAAEQTAINKTWKWGLDVLMDEPCQRVVWIVGEILDSIPDPRQVVSSATWKKILFTLGECITNEGDEQLIFRACQVATIFSNIFLNQNLGNDALWKRSIDKFAEAVVDHLCFREEISLSLKTRACSCFRDIMCCLDEEYALRLLVDLNFRKIYSKEERLRRLSGLSEVFRVSCLIKGTVDDWTTHARLCLVDGLSLRHTQE